MDLLAENLWPPRCIFLKGGEGVYRIRVGDFRIPSEMLDQTPVVQAIRNGHLREVYR